MASIDVVLDCGPLTAPLAGIGCYAANLLAALRSSDEIGSLRCFNGRDVRPVDELFSQPSSAASQWWPSAGPARFLKRVLRERQVAYEVRHWLRDRRFMHGVKGLEDHVYHQPAFILSPFAGRSVTTVHDLSFVRFPQAHPAGRVAYLLRHLPTSLDRADRILVPSEFTRQELLSLFALDARKVVVTPLGVSPVFRPRSEEECRNVLARYRLAYRRYVLFVGTLEPRKNLAMLMDAWLSLPASAREQYPLVIVGGRGWGDDQLFRRLKTLERHEPLRYLDYVPADVLPMLYSAASLMVYPSHYEGFGLPVLESMASGTPVICASGTAMTEFSDGAAFLFAAGKNDALKDVMSFVLSDSARVLDHVDCGLELARTYTWSACAAMTMRVYQSLG